MVLCSVWLNLNDCMSKIDDVTQNARFGIYYASFSAEITLHELINHMLRKIRAMSLHTGYTCGENLA